MLSRMRGLKRKLSEVQSQADAANHVTKARMEYLRSIPETTDDKEYDGWASKRLANHLADYFLRASPQLKKSAKELAKEKGVEELVDFEVWDELAKAENGLREKRLDEVLAWVGENKVALRKMKVDPSLSLSLLPLAHLVFVVHAISHHSNSRFIFKVISNCVDQDPLNKL